MSVNGWTPSLLAASLRLMGSPSRTLSRSISVWEKSPASDGMRRVLKNSESRTIVFSSCATLVRGASPSSPERKGFRDGHFIAAKHIGTTLSGESLASPFAT